MTSEQKRLTNPSYNGILSQGENNMKTETKMGRPKTGIKLKKR